MIAASYFARHAKGQNPFSFAEHGTAMASEEIIDSDQIMENTNEGSGSSNSTDEKGNSDADILVKVQSLFGEATYEALQSKIS